MYIELELTHILRTMHTLERRIVERFPLSGLAEVAAGLCRVGEETAPTLEHLRRPIWPVRIAAGFGLVVLLALAGTLAALLSSLSRDFGNLGVLLQSIESAAQDLIFLCIAMWFLLTLEGRLKRRIALRAMRRLRSIVHVVDMHQLTKDPEHRLTPGTTTASSPVRQLTRFELSRYLDYCTELLSLTSKLAALHVQYLNDPVVLDAVSDIEVLASNLSNKIWQKIQILDTAPHLDPSSRGVRQSALLGRPSRAPHLPEHVDR